MAAGRIARRPAFFDRFGEASAGYSAGLGRDSYGLSLQKKGPPLDDETPPGAEPGEGILAI